MQSITSGVYSLLVGEGDAGGGNAQLPPPLTPAKPKRAPPPAPAPTSCPQRDGTPAATRIILGPGDGTMRTVDALEKIARPMVNVANGNGNRVTVVLLKAPETTPMMEAQVRKMFETSVAEVVALPKIVINAKSEFAAVVATADTLESYAIPEGRAVSMNTGRPCVLVVTDCYSTYSATAPALGRVSLPRDAEEGYRALMATLDGILASPTFAGRDLAGTALGTFVRNDVQMRLIGWNGRTDGTDDVQPLLYTAVSEAYAQRAGGVMFGGTRPRRATTKPWFTITASVFLGDAIPLYVRDMPALDRDAWHERIGVRAWLADVQGEQLDHAVRDDDNLVGLSVGVSEDRLVFR